MTKLTEQQMALALYRMVHERIAELDKAILRAQFDIDKTEAIAKVEQAYRDEHGDSLGWGHTSPNTDHSRQRIAAMANHADQWRQVLAYVEAKFEVPPK